MTKRNKKDGKTPDREETSYTESEFIEAYRHEEARLEEIPDEELIPLRYSADEAMGRGLWLGRNAERDLDHFVEIYRDPPISEIKSMITQSLAIKGASIEAHYAEQPVGIDFEWARQHAL